MLFRSKELDEQILEDGAHFELSPMYHQIILFRVLEAIEWYRYWPNKKLDFLDFLIKIASNMQGWLCQISFKNGEIPHFNDSAPHVAFTTNQLLNFAALLKIEPSVKPLKDSGYRKFLFNEYECVVDVAQLGPVYQSGHSHADCLTFALNISDKPFIVDLGTSTYEIGDRRNIERSTQAHNTVNIKGANQSEVWAGFRVGKRAEVNILKENNDLLIAEHDGYWSSFKVMHRREFNFSVEKICIKDKIGEKTGKFVLHFHPSVKCSLNNEGEIITDKGVVLCFNSSSKPKLINYDFSNGFNSYKIATKAEVDFNNEIQTIIKVKAS